LARLVCRNIRDIVSARQHSAKRTICYRPSVRLSVTLVDQSKTFEVRITQFSPYSSPIPLAIEGYVSSRNPTDRWRQTKVGWGKQAIFYLCASISPKSYEILPKLLL